MKRFAAAIAAVCLLAGRADASGCVAAVAPVVNYGHAVNYGHIQKAVAVTNHYPVATVSTYVPVTVVKLEFPAVEYKAPAAVPPEDAAEAAELRKKVEATDRKLDLLLERLTEREGARAAGDEFARRPSLKAAGGWQAKCAACHTGEAAKGGGLALFGGAGEWVGSAEDAAHALASLEADAETPMPPKGKPQFTAAELAAAKRFLKGRSKGK